MGNKRYNKWLKRKSERLTKKPLTVWNPHKYNAKQKFNRAMGVHRARYLARKTKGRRMLKGLRYREYQRRPIYRRLRKLPKDLQNYIKSFY